MLPPSPDAAPPAVMTRDPPSEAASSRVAASGRHIAARSTLTGGEGHRSAQAIRAIRKLASSSGHGDGPARPTSGFTNKQCDATGARFSGSPVDSIMPPLVPSVEEPVSISSLPELPSDPAFTVRIVTSPEDVSEPVPDSIVMLPPAP